MPGRRHAALLARQAVAAQDRDPLRGQLLRPQGQGAARVDLGHLQFSAGNLKLNDKSTQTYADDSTDSGGNATITLPSFSGCGNITLRLYVSNKLIDIRTSTVRTTDTNADGRTTSADETSACNLNFNGTAGDTTDVRLVQNHADHWKRNVLHGTLVRRTNLDVWPLGEGELFWSPSGRWVSFSEHTSEDACKIFLLPSDPTYAPGAAPKQFTFEAPDTADYDGSWSPIGDVIVFERADYRVIRKGIPGLAADTTERLVTASGNGYPARGDLSPSISPNRQWVAFSRKNAGVVGSSLYKIPIGGGTVVRLTNTEGLFSADYYPRWSPDGAWITYQRELPTTPVTHEMRKVTSSGFSDQLVYSAGTGMNAANPAFSPDGAIITGAIGTSSLLIADTRTHTIDPLLTIKRPILNYPVHAIAARVPYMFPRLSPDGTRLGLLTDQVWAARRNMNLPPQFTTITGDWMGTKYLADTTAIANIRIDPFLTTPITVRAADVDTDSSQFAYKASFLESWMIWNEITHTLTCTPAPGTVGQRFYVKFWVTTPSGGTDSFIAIIYVQATLGPESATTALELQALDGPNPTRGQFAVVTMGEPPMAVARLLVFDLAGRVIRTVEGTAGDRLEWDTKDHLGNAVAGGVYLYRLDAGSKRRFGKLVIVK